MRNGLGGFDGGDERREWGGETCYGESDCPPFWLFTWRALRMERNAQSQCRSESWMLSRLLRLRQGRRRILRLGGGGVYLIDQISISHIFVVSITLNGFTL